MPLICLSSFHHWYHKGGRKTKEKKKGNVIPKEKQEKGNNATLQLVGYEKGKNDTKDNSQKRNCINESSKKPFPDIESKGLCRCLLNKVRSRTHPVQKNWQIAIQARSSNKTPSTLSHW